MNRYVTKMAFGTLTLGLLVCAAVAADRVPRTPINRGHLTQISGVVIRRDGRPLPGALVQIVSVGPRAGRSSTSPWCHPDCGKHAIAGASGEFTIASVDPAWLFTLAVEAKDCLPREVLVDARSTTALKIRVTSEEDRLTKGQVLNPDGTPAVGVVVVVAGFRIEQASPKGTVIDQRRFLTDDEGRFHIESEALLQQMQVIVTAPNATFKVYDLKPGGKENVLQLTTGATLTGRVLRQARPVSGIEVGLTGGAMLRSGAPRLTVTDAEGRFKLEHVTPGALERIFTKMTPDTPLPLAAVVRDVDVPADGELLDVGELNLHPTFRVRGRLVPLEGAVPANITATLERLRAPDHIEQLVATDGTFEFSGVPAESVVLSFCSPGKAAIQGYRLSARNFSVDEAGLPAMVGRVDEDLDLVVLIQKGAGASYVPGQAAQLFAPHNHKSARPLPTQALFGVTESLQSRVVERVRKSIETRKSPYQKP